MEVARWFPELDHKRWYSCHLSLGVYLLKTFYLTISSLSWNYLAGDSNWKGHMQTEIARASIRALPAKPLSATSESHLGARLCPGCSQIMIWWKQRKMPYVLGLLSPKWFERLRRSSWLLVIGTGLVQHPSLHSTEEWTRDWKISLSISLLPQFF